jgi:hypothetical protein
MRKGHRHNQHGQSLFTHPEPTPIRNYRVKKPGIRASGTRINSGPKTAAKPVSARVETYGLVHSPLLTNHDSEYARNAEAIYELTA